MVCSRPIRAYYRLWSLKTHRMVRQPQRHLPTKPLGLILSVCFYWLTRERVNILFQCHLIIFQIILYLRNILCTRNACFHTYILNSHVFQISLAYFFLLNTLRNLTHLCLVESLLTYVCDPGILLLRQFLHLFFYITCLIY